MTEIKPCPFCGGEANVVELNDFVCDRFTVNCKDSKCIGFYIGYINEGLFSSKEEAIEAWNRRVYNV